MPGRRSGRTGSAWTWRGRSARGWRSGCWRRGWSRWWVLCTERRRGSGACATPSPATAHPARRTTTAAGASGSPSSPHGERPERAVYGSGVQVEPAAVVVDACGAEQPGALDESVEQLGGERVDLRGGPGRAEELARDASPPFLPGEQRGVLERDAAAGGGGGAGDESAA